METIRTRENISLDCEFFGDEKAPLAVLISGAGAPAEFWPDFFCISLADNGFRVLRYCHRDTGLSTHFDVPNDIRELHEDLINLIDSTEKPGVSLVGRSMGGFLSQLAVQYTRSLYNGEPRHARVATNHVHAMSTIPADLVKKLPKIQCPFLVLHGTEDVLVPNDNGKVTARLLPHSKFIGLEGEGHMFFNKKIWSKILDHLVDHLRPLREGIHG